MSYRDKYGFAPPSNIWGHSAPDSYTLRDVEAAARREGKTLAQVRQEVRRNQARRFGVSLAEYEAMLDRWDKEEEARQALRRRP